MSDLSPLARTFLHALADLPEGLPDFGVELVAAVPDVDEPTAAALLVELLQHDIAVQRDGRYTITGIPAIVVDGHPADPAVELAVITWFVHDAVFADRIRDRHADRYSSAYDLEVASRFDTPAEVMAWYQPHHRWFVALLDHLIERKSYELSVTLAEAVFGLAGYGGHHHDQQHAALQALHALGRGRWTADSMADTDGGVARKRLYDMGIARFNLKLAFVLSNLHQPEAALRALDEAEQRGRELNDDRVHAAVHRGRGRTHHAAGNPTAAETELRAALDIDLAAGNQRMVNLDRRRLGAVLADLARHDEAGHELHLAATSTQQLGHQIEHARVLTAAGAAAVAADTPEKAIGPLTLALVIMEREEAGSDAYLADIYLALARARRATNDAPPTTERLAISEVPTADACFRHAVERYRQAHRTVAADAAESEWHQPK